MMQVLLFLFPAAFKKTVLFLVSFCDECRKGVGEVVDHRCFVIMLISHNIPRPPLMA